MISLFLGGVSLISIDIPMFISNHFLHSENIEGNDDTPRLFLLIFVLATSRSPFYNIIYMYIFKRESDKLNLFSMYIYNVYIYILKLNHLWGLLYPQRNFPPCPPLPGNPSRLLAPQSVEDVLTIQKMGNPRLITKVGSRIYQKGLRLLVYY